MKQTYSQGGGLGDLTGSALGLCPDLPLWRFAVDVPRPHHSFSKSSEFPRTPRTPPMGMSQSLPGCALALSSGNLSSAHGGLHKFTPNLAFVPLTRWFLPLGTPPLNPACKSRLCFYLMNFSSMDGSYHPLPATPSAIISPLTMGGTSEENMPEGLSHLPSLVHVGWVRLPCFPHEVILTSNKRLCLNARLKLSNVVLIVLLLSNLTIELNGTWKPDLGVLFLITAPCWDGQGSSLPCASSTLTDVSVPPAPRDALTLTRKSSFHEAQRPSCPPASHSLSK